MPSDKHHGRGRSSIVKWRVKAGKHDVFSDEKKGACDEFVRQNNGKIDGVKLRIVPPNKAGKR